LLELVSATASGQKCHRSVRARQLDCPALVLVRADWQAAHSNMVILLCPAVNQFRAGSRRIYFPVHRRHLDFQRRLAAQTDWLLV
jgi:hypothetical protein